MNNKILFLFLLLLTSCTESVDLIVHNADIYSADEFNTRHSSCAVKEGKFIYVGGDEILSKYSSTNIINVQGLPVYPGFIDSHAHFYDLGFYLNQVDLKNTKSLEEVIDRVTEFDAENNSNFIIYRITPSKLEKILNYDESNEYFRVTNFVAVNKNYI